MGKKTCAHPGRWEWGSWWQRWEIQRPQRKLDPKVWFGKLCFSGKDFEKPRFVSVAVIEIGTAHLQNVPCSYILSGFCSALETSTITLDVGAKTPPSSVGAAMVWFLFHCVGTWEYLCTMLRNCMLDLFFFSFFFFFRFHVESLWRKRLKSWNLVQKPQEPWR